MRLINKEIFRINIGISWTFAEPTGEDVRCDGHILTITFQGTVSLIATLANPPTEFMSCSPWNAREGVVNTEAFFSTALAQRVTSLTSMSRKECRGAKACP